MSRGERSHGKDTGALEIRSEGEESGGQRERGED